MLSTKVVLTIIILGVLAIAFVLWRVVPKRMALRMMQDFERKFPGKCVICAYYRYGLMEGYVKPGTRIPPHEGCPEKDRNT